MSCHLESGLDVTVCAKKVERRDTAEEMYGINKQQFLTSIWAAVDKPTNHSFARYSTLVTKRLEASKGKT